MKKVNIILVALFLLLSVGQLWAQRNRAALPYRTFESFRGDTVRYLEFNYTIRSVQYVGKTVGEILDELELPIIYISPTMLLSTGNHPSLLAGLTFGIKQELETPSERWDYYIEIRFENPPLLDEFREVSPVGNRIFTPEIYDFIKNLKVSMVGSNEFILTDPEILENRRRVFEENARRGREGQERWDRLVREREERERQEESERRERNRDQ